MPIFESNGKKFFYNDDNDSPRMAGGEMNNLYRLPKDLKIVIDIGAHMGGTAVYGATLGAEVYAYEPDRIIFDLFKKTIAENLLEKKIHAFNLAVCDVSKGRFRKLYQHPVYSVYNSICEPYLNTRNFQNKSYYYVKTISLAEIFSENKIDVCDVLKIDCEGSEEEILFSADKELFSRIKQISVEIDGDDNQKNKIVDFLKKFYPRMETIKNEIFFFYQV